MLCLTSLIVSCRCKHMDLFLARVSAPPKSSPPTRIPPHTLFWKHTVWNAVGVIQGLQSKGRRCQTMFIPSTHLGDTVSRLKLHRHAFILRTLKSAKAIARTIVVLRCKWGILQLPITRFGAQLGALLQSNCESSLQGTNVERQRCPPGKTNWQVSATKATTKEDARQTVRPDDTHDERVLPRPKNFPIDGVCCRKPPFR